MRVLRLALATLVLGSCNRAAGPKPGSAEYAEAVSSFYTGVAALQVGELERAEQALRRTLELAPREPAAATNLGIVAFQLGRHEEAAQLTARALSAAPDDARVRALAAIIARARGRLDEAIEQLRPAADAGDARARFLLAQLLEQRARGEDIVESRRLLYLLDTLSLFALVESARHAARHNDRASLERAVQRLEANAALWPAATRAQLGKVRAALAQPSSAGAELTVLAAALEPLPDYAAARAALAISEQQPDLVLTRFLRLSTPSSNPAPPDLGLRYMGRGLGTVAGNWRELHAFGPVAKGDEFIAIVDVSRGIWLAADTGEARQIAGPQPDSVLAFAAFDFDHDVDLDIAIAGSRGVRVLRHDPRGRFVGLPGLPSLLQGRAFIGVWPADTDMDGDVDLVAAPRGAAPFILRNQGDGSFAEQPAFDDRITAAIAFVWGDLDDDGDPDAVFLDTAGRVHAFSNPRRDLPRFVRMESPAALGSVAAIALADLNADATFDLITLGRDGVLHRSTLVGGDWRTERVGEWSAGTALARLFVADLDNNGALDVAASRNGVTQLWLADSTYKLERIEYNESIPVQTTAVRVGGDRIELLGVADDGGPVRLVPVPTRDYHAITLLPQAAVERGDRRINTYGLGGTTELRAGLLYQKQPITSSIVHFGIGENTGANVARIIWPNGTAQAEFDLLAGQVDPFIATQRLKGSCPWLFAHDGEGMQFVTDFIWRTALGLRINAFGSSAVIHSEDRVKLRGDQLAARDGRYTLSITGELWESHFFDRVALLAVDHPADTEVFVDERFTWPPPSLELQATGPLEPLRSARDDQGRDVTAILAARDGRYADGFELGRYQGVAEREHFVELELGAAPRGAKLLLIAHGWVYPTDGSINTALGQGTHTLPRGIRVDVPDGRGGWRVLYADLGMPAGKSKNVVIDLKGAFQGDGPQRVRLGTTMEIYWDHITWAEAKPATALKVAQATPLSAELRARGYSRTQAGRRRPELPEYVVTRTAQPWRDLEGYYTRFGDVKPLLQDVDDRYVIMNAGDELLLNFAELPPPPPGWKRDYVLSGDGWVKDGDFNNGFSKTLLPLPYHGLTDYSKSAARFEDDPAYRRHADDWRTYHTRYVSAELFHRALARD